MVGCVGRTEDACGTALWMACLRTEVAAMFRGPVGVARLGRRTCLVLPPAWRLQDTVRAVRSGLV